MALLAGLAARFTMRAVLPYIVGAVLAGYLATGVYYYNAGVQDCARRSVEIALDLQIKATEAAEKKAQRDREIAEQQVGKLKDIERNRNAILFEDVPPLGCGPSAEWLRYLRESGN